MRLDFLSAIKEPVICIVDGQETEYENGAAAWEFYKQEGGVYKVREIAERKGVFVILIDRDDTSRKKTQYRDDDRVQWVMQYLKSR